MKIKFLTRTITALFCFSSLHTWAAGFTVDHNCIDVSDNIIPQSYLNAARSMDVLFNHQSVGYNIIDGLWDLNSMNPTRYAFVDQSWPSPDWFDDHNGQGDFTAGSNGNPQSKVDGFESLIRDDGYGNHIDVAFMKFCYVDNTTSAAQIWSWYQTMMLGVEADYPDVQFVWWTMPLTTSGNQIRDQVNTLVREYCSANDKILFDMADIECHTPAGDLVTNSGYQALYSGYTSDGGHLNSTGRQRMARAWWWLMARCAGWSSSESVLLRVRTLLEGPYNSAGNEMTTALNSAGQLPLTSPYAQDAVTVTAIPDSITDWILLQLRETTSGAAVVSQSCFLSRTGSVVTTSGSRLLTYTVAPGSYYVVCQHRNHLAVMSAAAVALNSTTPVFYDFTDGAAKTYGTNGSKQLESGVWGMWCGDADQDKFVTSADYVRWFNDNRNGAAGYQISDMNCDSIISQLDYTAWDQNAQSGATSTLP